MLALARDRLLAIGSNIDGGVKRVEMAIILLRKPVTTTGRSALSAAYPKARHFGGLHHRHGTAEQSGALHLRDLGETGRRRPGHSVVTVTPVRRSS